VIRKNRAIPRNLSFTSLNSLKKIKAIRKKRNMSRTSGKIKGNETGFKPVT
jgi:hypothetical protein